MKEQNTIVTVVEKPDKKIFYTLTMIRNNNSVGIKAHWSSTNPEPGTFNIPDHTEPFIFLTGHINYGNNHLVFPLYEFTADRIKIVEGNSL